MVTIFGKILPADNLAIITRPSGEEYLFDDLLYLQREGFTTIISCLEQHEEASLGLICEGKIAIDLGMNFMRVPIPDRGIPDSLTGFLRPITYISGKVIVGEKVGVHCRQSVGRSSVVVLCVLCLLEFPFGQAIKNVRSARGITIPETEAQLNFVERFYQLAEMT